MSWLPAFCVSWPQNSKVGVKLNGTTVTAQWLGGRSEEWRGWDYRPTNSVFLRTKLEVAFGCHCLYIIIAFNEPAPDHFILSTADRFTIKFGSAPTICMIIYFIWQNVQQSYSSSGHQMIDMYNEWNVASQTCRCWKSKKEMTEHSEKSKRTRD